MIVSEYNPFDANLQSLVVVVAVVYKVICLVNICLDSLTDILLIMVSIFDKFFWHLRKIPYIFERVSLLYYRDQGIVHLVHSRDHSICIAIQTTTSNIGIIICHILDFNNIWDRILNIFYLSKFTIRHMASFVIKETVITMFLCERNSMQNV